MFGHRGLLLRNIMVFSTSNAIGTTSKKIDRQDDEREQRIN